MLLLLACAAERVEIPQEWRVAEAALESESDFRAALGALRRLEDRLPNGHPWQEVARTRAAWLERMAPRDGLGDPPPLPEFAPLPQWVGGVMPVDGTTLEWRIDGETLRASSPTGFAAAIVLEGVLYTVEGNVPPRAPDPRCCTPELTPHTWSRRTGGRVEVLHDWLGEVCYEPDDYRFVSDGTYLALLHDGEAWILPEGSPMVRVTGTGPIEGMKAERGRLLTVADDAAALIDLATGAELGRRRVRGWVTPDPSRAVVWGVDGTAWPLETSIPGSLQQLPTGGPATFVGDNLYYVSGDRLVERGLVNGEEREVTPPGAGELEGLTLAFGGRIRVGRGHPRTTWRGEPSGGGFEWRPVGKDDPPAHDCEGELGRRPPRGLATEEWSTLFDICSRATRVTATEETLTVDLPGARYTRGPDGLLLSSDGYEALLPTIPKGRPSPDGRWSVESTAGGYELVSTLAGGPVSMAIGGTLVTSGFSEDGRSWYTLDDHGQLRILPMVPTRE